MSLLVQNLDRLDENVKEEADGIHNSLGKKKDREVDDICFICSNRGKYDRISSFVVC